MRKPFLKFICNSASYFFFLFLLILVSQRIEDIMGWENYLAIKSIETESREERNRTKTDLIIVLFKGGICHQTQQNAVHCHLLLSTPSWYLNWCRFGNFCNLWKSLQIWVAGLIWSEIKQLWDVGLKEYVSDMWNVVDFITNSLYVATIGLRLRAYYDVSRLV